MIAASAPPPNAQVETVDVSEHCASCPIREAVGYCDAVPLKVFGQRTRYLFVGEAPGKQEAALREGFVGKSGQLLRRLIQAADIPLHEVAFWNVVLCPPREGVGRGIRTPKASEVDACAPHVYEAVRRLKPDLVIAVGKKAAGAFLRQGSSSIQKLHGRQFLLDQIGLGAAVEDFQAWYQVQRDAHTAADSPWQRCRDLWEGDPLWKSPELEGARLLQAMELLGWEPTVFGTPVMPIVHPAYALRAGEGWEEKILWALKRARTLVTGEVADDASQTSYRAINDPQALTAWVEETLGYFRAGQIGLVACDIETTEELGQRDVWKIPFEPSSRIYTIQFTRWTGDGVMIYVSMRGSVFDDHALMPHLVSELKRLLAEVPVVGQNFSFDALTLRCKLGITDIKFVGDTMLADHWLQMGKGLLKGLDELEVRYLGRLGHKREALDWRAQNTDLTFEDMPLDLQLQYACGDTDACFQLHYVISHLLQKEDRLDTYYDLHYGTHKVWEVIVEQQWAGMLVDQARHAALLQAFPPKIEAVVQRLHQNSFVLSFCQDQLDAYLVEARERNARVEEYERQKAEGTPGRRYPGKRRPIYDLATWIQDPTNRFNAGSWQQILVLWTEYMQLPLKDIPDLAWGSCPSCQKEHSCLCGVPRRPKTNADNRERVVDACATWAAAWQVRFGTDPRAEEMLESLAQVRQATEDISEYKSLDKAFGTYVSNLPDLIADVGEGDPNERLYPPYRRFGDPAQPWAIHSTAKLHGTVTGRIASSNPNAMNFPKPKEGIPDVREVYVSRWKEQGGLLLSSDLSQIEVRVAVCYARDREVAQAINAGLDVHRFMASKVYEIPYEAVHPKEQRQPTKAVVFGLLYGQGVTSLAARLGITEERAQQIKDLFFRQMPRFQRYIEAMEQMVRRYGYVTTMFGRRRYVPLIRSESKGEQARALREAVNTPIQSAASDMCLTAYGRVWQEVRRLSLPVLPYNTVHDSQDYDCAPGAALDLLPLVYYHLVVYPLMHWPWVIVRPDADFELAAASWGEPVSLKPVWQAPGTLDPERLVLLGEPARLDRVCETLRRSYAGLSLEHEGPHPDEAMAEKGHRRLEVQVSLKQAPRVRLVNGFVQA